MAIVVRVTKNTYTADPLCQWDLDRALKVYGLSLAKVPEVHFCHKGMSRAIVRQATMDASGVVRVKIPNSLLQKPYPVMANICTYEGSTFKTLYRLEIPVRARSKPCDYTLEDDPEIYSFNALENAVVNALASMEQAVETCQKAADKSVKDVVGYTKEEILSEGTKALYDGAGNPDEVFGIIDTRIKQIPAALGLTKIATGSYEGSGATASNNTPPIELTSPFQPKLIVISNGASCGFFVPATGSGVALIYGTSGPIDIPMVVDGNTVRIQGYRAPTGSGAYTYPLNTNGSIYHYITFG